MSLSTTHAEFTGVPAKPNPPECLTILQQKHLRRLLEQEAMHTPPLPADTAAVLAYLAEELYSDDRVKVAGIDIDGTLRGKIMSKEKFLSSVKSGGFGFCSVVFGWDMHDKPYEAPPVQAGQPPGGSFGDILAKVDLTTFRRIPWEQNIPFFLLDFLKPRAIATSPTASPVELLQARHLEVCPRSLLKITLARLAGHVAVPGVRGIAGVEFEWFNYRETPHTLAEKKHRDLKALTPGMFGYSLLRPTVAQDFFYDAFDQCNLFGIRLECLHTETGPGVYEAALRYGHALELADRGGLFKTSLKQLGLLQPQLHPGREPIYPSFMAKPSSQLPGCSGHLHVSLMTKDGVNLFYDAADPNGMSAMFKQFLAGVLICLPHIMPMYAPTINSYKRLVENYWAPVKVCWGFENRTAAVRVITPQATGMSACTPEGTRAEIRVSGADINVHLALSAIFASGLYGMQHSLTLPPPILGDVLQEDARRSTPLERLPKSLQEAAERMRHKDSLAWELFGTDFVQHFTHTRMQEWRQWERQVTDWEVARYFETV